MAGLEQHKLLTMKIKLVILCIFGYLSGNAQTDSTILKTPDELWGAGNNKFAYTVNCIQSYLVSPHTVTQFEKNTWAISEELECK
ncbi:MAG: hypothetical protein WDO71_11680 [Bacteroidota bacterium]